MCRCRVHPASPARWTQDTEARRVALDKEQAQLQASTSKQAQHVADLQATTKTLSSEVSGAQKQRSQMLDSLKRLSVLVRCPALACACAPRAAEQRQDGSKLSAGPLTAPTHAERLWLCKRTPAQTKQAGPCQAWRLWSMHAWPGLRHQPGLCLWGRSHAWCKYRPSGCTD